MKKKIAFIMSVVMIGSVFTGCGSSDSSSSSKEAASTKASAEASEGTTASEASTEETTTEADTTAEKTTEKTTEAETSAPTESGAPAEGIDQFLGKWACSEMVMNGQTLTEMPLFNIPLDAFIHAEILSDGTIIFGSGIIGMDDSDESSDSTAKWEKKDDSSIIVKADTNDVDFVKEEQEIIFDGDTFSFSGEDEGQTVEVKFKRVSEFPTYDMTEQLQQMSEAFAKAAESAEESLKETTEESTDEAL